MDERSTPIKVICGLFFCVEYRKEEEMTRSFLPLLSMLKFVMVSPTEKAVSFRNNLDGASRSRDLVQKKAPDQFSGTGAD